MVEGVVDDLFVWVVTFAAGGIVGWLIFLTVRHYRYAKPAYHVLAGDDFGKGHLEETQTRFDEIDESHRDNRKRIDRIEAKVDSVDNKTNRNYRVLIKLAEKAGVDSVFFRDSSDDDDD